MVYTLDKLEDTTKRVPAPVSMIRSRWRHEVRYYPRALPTYTDIRGLQFMKQFTYYGGVETHCTILTSSILSKVIVAYVLGPG